MKIIKPSHQILNADENPLLTIEHAGRLCYKSEENITEASAEKFVNNLIDHGHFAMLEHATIYLMLNDIMYKSFLDAISPADAKYLVMSTSTCNGDIDGRTVNIISGNVRAWFELLKNKNSTGAPYWSALFAIQLLLEDYMPAVFGKLRPLDGVNDSNQKNTINSYQRNGNAVLNEEELTHVLKKDSEALKRHHRISVKFVCDRGVSHEFVRHRDASFAQESTRYCNYTKGKFGSEITVIDPFFFEENATKRELWVNACEMAEKAYFNLIAIGTTPQEARSVLPNSLKTEIIITATESEWQHICDLRAKGVTGAPHPQMKEVMEPCYKELIALTNHRIN